MESKITIHTGDDFKPVIKVLEKSSNDLDVRDDLVKGFRHLLKHGSGTCRIEFGSQDTVVNSSTPHICYYVVPVEDEIAYAKEILEKHYSTAKQQEEYKVHIILSEQQKIISGNMLGKYKMIYKGEPIYLDNNHTTFTENSYFEIFSSIQPNEIESMTIKLEKIVIEENK